MWMGKPLKEIYFLLIVPYHTMVFLKSSIQAKLQTAKRNVHFVKQCIIFKQGNAIVIYSKNIFSEFVALILSKRREY